MFSIAKLYNSASSNTVNPIRIYPIMMSIVFHYYKTLKEKNLFDKDLLAATNFKTDINNIDNNNNNNIILKREIDKWNNYSLVLRKPNRILLNEMLQSSYKYSNAINAKGKEFSTESLFVSLIFDQHKILLRNIVCKNSNILVKDNG